MIRETPRPSEDEQLTPAPEQAELASETQESIDLRAAKREVELLKFQEKTYEEFGGVAEFNKILARANKKNERNQGMPGNKQKPLSEEELAVRKIYWGIVEKYGEIHKEQKDALKSIGIEPKDQRGDMDAGEESSKI